MTVVAFRPSRLSETDVRTLRSRILALIDIGRASCWDVEMETDGYASVTVRGPHRDRLFAITKTQGTFRVVNERGRRVVESRRIENVLAVLD